MAKMIGIVKKRNVIFPERVSSPPPDTRMTMGVIRPFSIADRSLEEGLYVVLMGSAIIRDTISVIVLG